LRRSAVPLRCNWWSAPTTRVGRALSGEGGKVKFHPSTRVETERCLRVFSWAVISAPMEPRTRGHHTRCPPRSAVLVPFVALQSFSQSLCDEKGVAGLLQAHDLAVSDCPEMGESGLHLPPLLRNAEIASENDHAIAQLEVLVPFRVELVEIGQECEEIINNRVYTAIDAPVGESFRNIILDVIRQERFENIHVSPGAIQFPDESDLRRIRHANPP